jgi:transcriptional regulator with XRE-family HTH domain
MVVVPPKFESFGERLRWWRIHRGYQRQGKFAEAVKLGQGSLSDMENNKIGVSAETLLRFADALGLRPQYLLTGEGPPEGKNFQELNGLEAQLVMIFRQLPTDGLRDALLIDANNMLNRARAGEASTANPFAGVPPPPSSQEAGERQPQGGRLRTADEIIKDARIPSPAAKKTHKKSA